MLDQQRALDDLIADYLQRVDAGEQLRPEDFVAIRPELKQDFLAFIRRSQLVGEFIDPVAGDTAREGLSNDRDLSSSQFGEFHVLKVLGQGGMGIVYHAIQPEDGQTIALKVLRYFANSKTAYRTRFQREARAIESLQHPHIVKLVSSGEVRGTPFLAMQLIDAVTAHDVIASQISQACSGDLPHDSDRTDSQSETGPQRTTPITGQTVDACLRRAGDGQSDYYQTIANLLADVADALQHAHESGIIHRDVKPSNLLLDTDGKLWLTDFGLASLGEEQTAITATDDVLGTLNYMSPEQALGGSSRVNHRTDIYSLGASLYELATLSTPFQGNRHQVLLQVIEGNLESPSKRRANLPRGLEAIIVKAMSRSAGDRYATAAQLATDLRRFAAGEYVAARLPSFLTRIGRWVERNPRPAIGSAAGFLATILAIVGVQSFNSYKLAKVNDRLQKANLELNSSNENLEQSRAVLRQNLYVADMSAAFRAYADKNLVLVRQLLDRQAPDPVQSVAQESGAQESGNRESGNRESGRPPFVWRLLDNLIKPPESVAIATHELAATEAAFVPGSTKVVSVGRDGVVRLSDLNQLGSQTEFKLKGELNAFAVSPDGAQFVTEDKQSGVFNRVAIWSIEDGQVIRLLTGHRCTVESAAWSPDGKLVATAGRYQDILIHSTDGRLLKRITTGSRNESLMFTPDGKSLFAVMRREDKTQFVQGWNTSDFKATVEFPFWNSFTFGIARDSDRVVVAEMETIGIGDWRTGKRIADSMPIGERIRCIALSDDGQTIAAGCDQGDVFIWDLDGVDLSTGQLLEPTVIRASRDGITSVSFRPAEKRSEAVTLEASKLDPKRLLVTAEDGTTKLWELSTASPRYLRPKGDREGLPLARPIVLDLVSSSKDSNVMFLRLLDGTIARLNTNTEIITPIVRVDSDEHGHIAISPDERTLVASSVGEIVLVDLESGNVIQRVPKHAPAKTCHSLVWSAKGNQILALFNDHLCRYPTGPGRGAANEIKTDRAQVIKLPDERAHQLLQLPKQDRFLIVTLNRLLFLDGDQLSVLRQANSRSGEMMRVGVSNDGSLLAISFGDYSIEVLDTRDGFRQVNTFRGHEAEVLNCKFIDGNQTLVTTAYDKTIRFWDLSTGRESGLLRWPFRVGAIVSFVDNERRMLTADLSHPIQLWSAE